MKRAKEDLNEDMINDQAEFSEEKKSGFNLARAMAIMFILTLYLYIFAKILFLK